MQCPLCTDNTDTALTCQQKKYYHCSQCDLIFLDPKQRPTSKEEKARYLAHNNTIVDKGYVNYLEHFLHQGVDPFIARGMALDFGCGPGPVLQMLLQQRGFSTDINDPFFAPEKPPAHKKYDLITCTEVLEHVFQPAKTWRYFAQHLRPGGYLAVMTCFHPGQKNFGRWWYRQDFTHVCFYSRLTFAWVAANHPFQEKFTDNQRIVVLKRC
jgi:SAM-dependent methyltransferase